MRLSVILCVWLSGVAVPAFAQGEFFVMDYSSGEASAAGWPGGMHQTGCAPTCDTHDLIRQAGAGPQGQDAYLVEQKLVSNPADPQYVGEFYWGWYGLLEGSQPAQGSTRYYRYRIRWTSNSNFRGRNTEGLVTETNKLMIIGDGCSDRCRIIFSYRGHDNGRQVEHFRVQIDGGVDFIEVNNLKRDTWYNMQVELKSSTDMSTADGGYKLWINNDNYSSPNATRANITLRSTNDGGASGWRYVQLGAYSNNGLYDDGVHAFLITDFEAATEFASGWNRGEEQAAAGPTHHRHGGRQQRIGS